MSQPTLRLIIPTWSVDGRKGGIQTYLFGLVRALAEIAEVETTLLCTRGNVGVFDPLAGKRTRLEVVAAPLDGRGRPVVEQLMSKRGWRRWGDVVLTPSNVGLLRVGLPQVVVVQATLLVPAVWRDYGHLFPGRHRALRIYRSVLGLTLSRADAVIAVSPWLRERLLESFPKLDPSTVRVVPEGVDVDAFASPAAARDGSTVLFVSTLYPYKGARELLLALAEVQARSRVSWTCRIVGRDPTGGQETASLAHLAQRLGIGDRVELVGHVPHDRIQDEYRSAAVFVYPSLLESFGLPPLEAMATRTPVIASNVSSVASTVGTGGMLVDATDPGALASAIIEVLESPRRREELARRGWLWANEMTWARTARDTTEVIRSVLR